MDADEELFWRALMRLVITVPRAMSDDLERTAGLNGTEYTVLMHLSEAPNHQLRIGDLADRTALSASRISRVVDLMSERGLVARRPDPADRRSMWATLTRQGMTAIREAYPEHLQSVRRNVFDHLRGNESASVGRVLDRLADAVDAASLPAPRRTASRRSAHSST